MELLSGDGRVTARSRILSQSIALTRARSVVKSHLGDAIIRNSTSGNAVYQVRLRRLETENVWRLRELDNDKKQFLAQRGRLPGPTLVVDRPPSCGSVCLDPRRDNSQIEFDGPRYMKPTLRTTHALPVIPTIDAFRTFSSRPTPAADVTDATRRVTSAVRFRSAVLPSCPLTEDDQSELRLHWNHHWLGLRHQRRRRSPSPPARTARTGGRLSEHTQPSSSTDERTRRRSVCVVTVPVMKPLTAEAAAADTEPSDSSPNIPPSSSSHQHH